MVVKVKAKMIEAYYDDVNRMIAELEKLKKAPNGDKKAEARRAEIKKAFAEAEVEKFQQKAMAYDARELKKTLKEMF